MMQLLYPNGFPNNKQLSLLCWLNCARHADDQPLPVHSKVQNGVVRLEVAALGSFYM